MMRKIAKQLIPQSFHTMINDFVSNFSFIARQDFYGQEGEDAILKRYFGPKKGYYVDVGANHPYLYSNTYRLSKDGWRGINIEPYPGRIALFKKKRSKDINLAIGISQKESKLFFYAFKESQVSTFDEKTAKNQIKNGVELKKKITIQTLPLKKVLNDKHVTKIDFLTVDVEGFDLEVLKSNDWNMYRPTMVAIEDHGFDLENPKKSSIHVFMKKQKYKLYARTNSTSFYENTKMKK